MERGKYATWSYSKHCTIVTWTALQGNAIEISIATLYEGGFRVRAVTATETMN